MTAAFQTKKPQGNGNAGQQRHRDALPLHTERGVSSPMKCASLMATFTIYSDVSGHPDGTDVLSVAGFIANN
jgi:hypothetical protein